MKILIIEDHPKLRENVVNYFKIKWFTIEEASNWKIWLEKALVNNYDIIILDINMPILNWKEFLYEFRNHNKNTSVIALTSNNTLDDKTEIFNLWVDDYLTKPFELKELELRVSVLWRRQEKTIEDIIKIENIEINLSSRKVFISGEKIELWNKEFLIIEFLAKNKWYPKTKIDILEKVWWEAEENLELSSTTLEAHISTIRKKLWKTFIKTIKWVWYIIE